MKDQWEEKPYEVEHKVAEGIPSYLIRNQWIGCSWVLHWNWLFLITSTEGTAICMIMHAEQSRCTTTTLEEQTPWESETEEAPQSANCPSLAHHQTGKTPLGWVNRKLHAFIWTISRASLLDKGWKVLCRGTGVCGCPHWCSRGRGTDHTGEAWKTQLTTTSSTPPLFILETASSQHRGYEMGALAHASIFGATIPSWIQMHWNSWCSPCKGPCAIVALPMGEEPCSAS